MIGQEALLAALRRMQVETGSLVCLGCGYEHNCSIHGCAILREAVKALEAPETNADRIRAMSDEELAKEINRLMEGETSIPYCRELPVCDEDVERDALIPLERCEQCVLQWLHQSAEE